MASMSSTTSSISSSGSSSVVSRTMLPTSIFTHQAARLVKTIPPLQPPVRINGNVPRDTLGIGHLAPSDVVLVDVYGPLSMLVVPDPFNPNIATLVLSVGFEDSSLQGAARKFVLPFRSFQVNSDTGSIANKSKVDAFDASQRSIYEGLGAGIRGVDGGSFWFFEDVGEEGAFDRFRWEQDGVGKKAIWTVWLLSTPAPVVRFAKELLEKYPKSVNPLPPILKDGTGFPWRDNYMQLPTPPRRKVVTQSSSTTAKLGNENAGRNNAKPLPAVPLKPNHLRGTSSSRPEISASMPMPQKLKPIEDTDAIQKPQETPQQPLQLECSSHLVSSPPQTVVEDVPITNSTATTCILAPEKPMVYTTAAADLAIPVASKLDVRSRHLKDGSSPVSIGDTPEVILRDPPCSAVPVDYRNSLVAVDNETGQIISVLASDVTLGARSTPVVEGSSDEDDEQEAQTPNDDILRRLGDNHVVSEKGHESIGRDDLGEASPLTTPRQSTIKVHRPISVYRDGSVDRLASRPPSFLAADTFAPPPLPPKNVSSGDQGPSRRTSTASAAFFSASESDADPDADSVLEHRSDEVNSDNAHAHYVSIKGANPKDVEMHRPELLYDIGRRKMTERFGDYCDGGDTDDDARSERSGSTIGGPAVRLWRRAIGKGKKKPGTGDGQSEQVDPKLKRDSCRQPSQASDRTSKAETAFESISDEEEVGGKPSYSSSDITEADAEADRETEAVGDLHDSASALASRFIRNGSQAGHLPRSALRTEEIRTIEDKVWREALESGELPVDAAYTHLAARGYRPSCSTLYAPFSPESGSIELLSPQEKETRVREARVRKNKTANLGYMQGGTVLIEFLAGSSRIGASIIRSAGLETVLEGESTPTNISNNGMPANSSKAIGGMLGLVPLLPQHIWSFFRLSTSTGKVPDLVGATSVAVPAPSYLPALALPTRFSSLIGDATSWMGNLFNFTPTAATITQSDSNSSLEENEADLSKAEEWEYAIPEFDPNSLASTPRPIYRRKRPVPSAQNGFAVRNNDTAVMPPEPLAKPVQRQATRIPSDSVRYSILHIDSLGVGRRAFLQGVSAYDGLR